LDWTQIVRSIQPIGMDSDELNKLLLEEVYNRISRDLE